MSIDSQKLVDVLKSVAQAVLGLLLVAGIVGMFLAALLFLVGCASVDKVQVHSGNEDLTNPGLYAHDDLRTSPTLEAYDEGGLLMAVWDALQQRAHDGIH